MHSFWSNFNSGLLFFSLVAWIGGAIILVSSFKDSLSSDQQLGILIAAIFLILTFHSFWGMLVEMSKNVIRSEEREDLTQENSELRKKNEELTEKNISLAMLVEKSKKTVSRQLEKSGEEGGQSSENNKLKKENRELKVELSKMYDELNALSARLRLLDQQSSEQEIQFNFSEQEKSEPDILFDVSEQEKSVQDKPVNNSEQEIPEQNYVGKKDKKKDTRPWICNNCGNFNPASSVICGSCGQQKSSQ